MRCKKRRASVAVEGKNTRILDNSESLYEYKYCTEGVPHLTDERNPEYENFYKNCHKTDGLEFVRTSMENNCH